MKNITATTIVLLIASMNAAFASKNYSCREAIKLDDQPGYSAIFVYNGASMDIQVNSIPAKKVKVSFYHKKQIARFKAKIQMPGKEEQGMMGSIQRDAKDFSLDFYMMPNYKEMTSQDEYMGADLHFRSKDMFMLCEPGIEYLFAFEECFDGCK